MSKRLYTAIHSHSNGADAYLFFFDGPTGSNPAGLGEDADLMALAEALSVNWEKGENLQVAPIANMFESDQALLTPFNSIPVLHAWRTEQLRRNRAQVEQIEQDCRSAVNPPSDKTVP